jgi:hypothetical protein
MTKLHIPFLILAFALPLAIIDQAGAAINNGGGPGAKAGCGTAYAACTDWCNAHNKTNNSFSKCIAQCGRYYGCTGVSAAKKPGGTGAAPIINGKPVEAPPPPKGSNPTNAAPVTNGKPTQASPSGGGGKLK